MNDTLDRLLDSFRRACRPPARLIPSQWASGRVSIMDGLTPKYQIENAPWQREPLDTLCNADAKEVVFLAPIGTGKTTFMEAGLSYIVAEDPGPTLLVGQTDDDLKDWAETRMDYAIRNTPETALLLPEDRHKKRKMQILFPHMSLFLTGANLSGLQAKSMRRVFCDEAWQYKRGMLTEARGRLHDRWNRQFFVMSQAGYVGDDLDKAWHNSDKREFVFDCPKCGTTQPWRWVNVEWDQDESLSAIDKARTARIRCDNKECDWSLSDHSQRRRELSESARYMPTGQGVPGHIGFHYNTLCNWRKPLWELVLLWLEAQEALKGGNNDPLRQFLQKRLAEPWNEDHYESRPEIFTSGYTIGEYAQGEPIDNEEFRFITVDVQRDHFWVCIRAWTQDGESRLLYYAKHETFDQIKELSERYKVGANRVLIDAGYNRDMVLSACAFNGWRALMGRDIDSFPHFLPTGEKISLPYSKARNEIAQGNRNAKLYFWSSERVKDILYAHRTGEAQMWEIPEDAPDEYTKQIDSESKKEDASGKTKQAVYRWVRIKKNNHAWDCEAMQMVAAMMCRIVPGFK
jgi:phage terminase large subunit GpA-like protein